LALTSGKSRRGPQDPPAHRHKKKEAAHDERERPKSREETPKEGYTARRQSLPYELEDVGALRNNQGTMRHFLAYQIQLAVWCGFNVAKPSDLTQKLNYSRFGGVSARICPGTQPRARLSTDPAPEGRHLVNLHSPAERRQNPDKRKGRTINGRPEV